MKRLDFEVFGEVVGAARPRVTKFGTYLPKKTRDYRKKIQDAFIASCGGRVAPIEKPTPVCVEIYVYRAMPKSRPKKMLFEPDVFKPDVDNVSKNVLDALNGVAWEDDSQVVRLFIEKFDRKRRDEFIRVVVMEA